jgi:hypothetical protein
MTFIEKAKLMFQMRTTWVILAHLFIVFPVFGKILYDIVYDSDKKKEGEKKERSAWIDIGIWMLILGVVYHVYLFFEYSILY